MPSKVYQVAFSGEAVEDSFYGDIQDLVVQESIEGGSFTMRLGLTLDDNGAWNYLDDDRFLPFTATSIWIGFQGGMDDLLTGTQGGMEPVLDGYVTDVNLRVGSEPSDVWLEVRGRDTMVLLSLEEKAVAWPNMADSDIAQEIVTAYGGPVQATTTTPVRQDTDTLMMQRGTDASFVRQLARRNGFEFYFSKPSVDEPSTCYFGPPQLQGTPQPDLAIRFGQDSNLRSFDVSLTGLRPLAVNVAQVDAETKQSSTGQASDMQLDPLGNSTLTDLTQGQLDTLITPLEQQGLMLLAAQPTSDQTELQAVAQAVRDEAGWLISARGEINSDAYGFVLRPGRTVLVKGAGSQFSGTYYVTGVTHELRSDGSYRQSFEARRNARDLTGSESFGGGPGGLLGLVSS